jgi:hypothetical protein
MEKKKLVILLGMLGIVGAVLFFMLRKKQTVVLDGEKQIIQAVSKPNKPTKDEIITYVLSQDKIKFQSLPVSNVLATIDLESSFDIEPPISSVNSSGEIGLGQITPIALEDVNNLSDEKFTIEQIKNDWRANVRCTRAFLKILLDRWKNWDSVHRAYNTGNPIATTAGQKYLENIKKRLQLYQQYDN